MRRPEAADQAEAQPIVGDIKSGTELELLSGIQARRSKEDSGSRKSYQPCAENYGRRPSSFDGARACSAIWRFIQVTPRNGLRTCCLLSACRALYTERPAGDWK